MVNWTVDHLITAVRYNSIIQHLNDYSYEEAWQIGVDMANENAELSQRRQRFGSFGQLVSSMCQFLQTAESEQAYEVHKGLVPIPTSVVSVANKAIGI